MKTCPNCGKPLDENVTFCTNCGYKVTQIEEENHQNINTKPIRKKTYKLPILILIIAILSLGVILGILLGKDTIMYNYYLQKGNKETSIPQAIEYYTSALKLKYETAVITQISERIKQDDNFEETLKTIEPVIKTSDIEKIYREIYVKKAKENFKEKNYETTLGYLAKAQNYGYNINDFEYYNDLKKVQQEYKEDDKIVNNNYYEQNVYDYDNNGFIDDYEYADYFIIYDSGLRYLTREELSYYSKDDLALIRNEIFARHGYVFKKEEYRNYFMSMPWYTPNPSFKGTTQELNKIERSNVELIKELENN